MLIEPLAGRSKTTLKLGAAGRGQRELTRFAKCRCRPNQPEGLLRLVHHHGQASERFQGPRQPLAISQFLAQGDAFVEHSASMR
jgi:hypothetical protein